MDKNMVGVDERLSSILLELYQGVRKQPVADFRHWALERLQPILDFDSAMWGVASNSPNRMYEVYLHNQPPEMMENYVRYQDQDFLRVKVCETPGVTVNLADLVSREELIQSVIYREHARRFNMEAVLCTVSIEPVTTLTSVISLWRADSDRQFSEQDRKTKEFLAPHLFECCRNNRMMHMRRACMPFCESHIWAAIGDTNGCLHHVETGFIELMLQEWPDWTGSMVPAALKPCFETKQEFNYMGHEVAIHGKKAETLYLVQVREKLAVDRLTPRETCVAEFFGEGKSHKQIAKVLGVAPSTVKNHLAAIYQKLNIHNKAQLVTLLQERMV